MADPDVTAPATPAPGASSPGARPAGAAAPAGPNPEDIRTEAPVFAGLRVLDCGSFIAAPAAATMLGDLGAEVIKIEPPGAGDALRGLHGMPGLPECDVEYAWMLDNRGKRGLALDLKRPEGQAVLHRLAATADVFVTNAPLDVRPRLGIAAETLCALNPRLVYASFTAYGEAGAEASKTGFDATAYWARSGLMDLVRPDAVSPPARSVAGLGDHPSATALFGAIVTGLYRREATGRGGVVSSSLLGNGIWANGYFVQAKLCGGTIPVRPPRARWPNALANLYRCRDGRWILLVALNEERQFPALLAALGVPELAADPRFAAQAERRRHAGDLTAALDAAFGAMDLAECRAALDREGVTFGLVGTLDDLVDDAQARDAGAIVRGEHGWRTVASPVRIEGAPLAPPRRAPALGEHGRAILAEAGYDAAGIERLIAAGVVTVPDRPDAAAGAGPGLGTPAGDAPAPAPADAG